jgi:hypothetical protein
MNDDEWKWQEAICEIASEVGLGALAQMEDRRWDAYQTWVQLAAVDLWVEVFHGDEGFAVVVSFDSSHSPELARDAFDFDPDKDYSLVWIADAITSSVGACLERLRREPMFVAALLDLETPDAAAGAQPKRL